MYTAAAVYGRARVTVTGRRRVYENGFFCGVDLVRGNQVFGASALQKLDNNNSNNKIIIIITIIGAHKA